MATLYYNGAVNTNWDTLGNWWTDPSHTAPASGLPTASDDVVLAWQSVYATNSSPTVANLSTVPSYPGSTLYLGISITVTGTATFNGEWYFTQYISGNVAFSAAAFTNWPSNWASGTTTFTSLTPVAFAVTSIWYNDVSLWIFDTPDPVWTFASGLYLSSGGNIHGNVIFNGSSSGYNGGQITGNVTFNDSTYNYGQITGTATFNDNSYNNSSSTVTGTAIFNDYSYNGGTVTGDAEFSGGDFTDISIGSVSGTVTFTAATPVIFYWTSNGWNYDTSLWVFTTPGENWIFSSGSWVSYSGWINSGTATFNGNSYNSGGLYNATFNDSSYNAYGTVANDATFNDTSNNQGTVSNDATFNDDSYNSGYGTVANDATFNDDSYNDGAIPLDATFNGNSRAADGSVFSTSSDLVFNHNSRLEAFIDVNSVTFTGNSQNIYGIINGGYHGGSNILTVAHGGGINGSNILGVV